MVNRLVYSNYFKIKQSCDFVGFVLRCVTRSGLMVWVDLLIGGLLLLVVSICMGLFVLGL